MIELDITTEKRAKKRTLRRKQHLRIETPRGI